MEIRKVCLPLLAILFFSACQNDESVKDLMKRPTVAIVANIGNVDETSRYKHDVETDNASFSDTDQIGVFMDDDAAVKWYLNGSSWKTDTPMYWADRTELHDFYAFYPYITTAVKNKVPMPSLEAQNGKSVDDIGSYDFLVASAKDASFEGTDGEITLTFSHVSSLLKLTLENVGDLKGARVDKITIRRVGLLSPCTYSFVDGAVNPAGGSINELVWNPQNGHKMVGNLSLYFIINGDLSENKDEATFFSIEYTHVVDTDTDSSTEKHYEAKRSDFPLSPVGGNRYMFDIKINSGQELIITGSKITPWEGDKEAEDVVINGGEKTPAQNG